MEDFKNYLQSKNLSPMTIKMYTREINHFISWYGTIDIINVQKKDVLNYLSYLKNEKNYQTVSTNHGLIALRHYFDGLVFNNELTLNPTSLIKLRGLKKRRLNYIYNPEELTELADNYYQIYVKQAEENLILKAKRNTTQNSYYAQLRNYVMLQFFIHQGLTTREVLELKTADLDLQKATVNIQTTTRGKDRTIPLHVTQIGFLMQYINQIRPQLAYTESEKLFLPTSQKNATENPKYLTKKYIAVVWL